MARGRPTSRSQREMRQCDVFKRHAARAATGQFGKYSVNPFPYRHKIVAKSLRSGYSQMSLTGISCRWLEDFLPRPAVRPT